ncbi:MAG: hypothetical protein ACK59C_00615 [Holosporales bacterium]
MYSSLTHYKPQALPLPGGTAPQCVRLADISSAADVPAQNGVVVLSHDRLFSELEQLATTFNLPPFSRQELEAFFISNHDVLTDKSINVAAGSLAAINHRPAKPDPILVVPPMEAFYTPELMAKIAAIYRDDFKRGGVDETKLPNMAMSEPYQLMQRLAAVVGENHPLTGAVLRAVHEQQYEQAIIESIAGRASQTN